MYRRTVASAERRHPMLEGVLARVERLMYAVSLRRWHVSFAVVATFCTGLATVSASNAQSLDPQKPAPLAPGLNKGNVDSFEGPHYYYFWARPGHFDATFAFQAMG